MTTAQIIEIKKRKGTSLPIDFIERFAKEWDAVVSNIKSSGADLSKIHLAEEPINKIIKLPVNSRIKRCHG